MKKVALIALFGIFLMVGAASAQTPTRIRFARGATSATVSAPLSGFGSKRAFVIRVRAGQTMTIKTTRSVTILVLDPSGADVMDRDLGCNGRAEISPTVAGDYRIEVYECQKADPWRGRFTMTVTVK